MRRRCTSSRVIMTGPCAHSWLNRGSSATSTAVPRHWNFVPKGRWVITADTFCRLVCEAERRFRPETEFLLKSAVHVLITLTIPGHKSFSHLIEYQKKIFPSNCISDINFRLLLFCFVLLQSVKQRNVEKPRREIRAAEKEKCCHDCTIGCWYLQNSVYSDSIFSIWRSSLSINAEAVRRIGPLFQ